MLSERRCALVTFLMRSSAEEAAKALYRNLSVNGQQLKIWWAKPRAADGDAPRHGQPGGASSAPAGPPPLPGARVEAGQLRSLYPSMNPNAMGARPDH